MEYVLKFGQNAPVNAKGEQAGETLTVEYSIDGTPFVLGISPNKVLHKSMGDGLEVEFVGGKRTEGRIKYGNMTAPYPVFCSLIKIEECGSSRDITVVFDDGDGQKTVNITLSAKGAN